MRATIKEGFKFKKAMESLTVKAVGQVAIEEDLLQYNESIHKHIQSL